MTGRTIERLLNADLMEVDLEDEPIQWLTQELVRTGMETPLRDAILAAVEETTSEAESVSSEELSIEEETREKSRTTEAIQGLTVFVVLFVTLYVTINWLTSNDES